MTSVTPLFAPVDADLQQLTENLKQLIGARHPILGAAAEHLFGTGGKRLRPALVLLASRATMLEREITPRHRRLAEITEMIHTASLVHDDVIDESETRRHAPTVNTLFDNRVAVLAGDFLFAQSSWYLANLDNLDVVKLLSEVIRDFAEGEIRQAMTQFDTELSQEDYIKKSYYKTASLMANSVKAAGVLSEVEPEVADRLYGFGRSFGLAFQIVDDILDFTATQEVLGKPVGSDLASGNLTAPVLFALEECAELAEIIEREFREEGDLERALAMVEASKGIDRARDLARDYAREAVSYLEILDPSPSHQALSELADYSISRLF